MLAVSVFIFSSLIIMYRIQNRAATVSIAIALSLALLGGSFVVFTPKAQAASNEEIKALITSLLAQITTLQALVAERNSAEGGFKGEPFSVGDEVVTVSILKVRSAAIVGENVIAYQQTSAKGTIVAGPETNGGYTWWKIAYTNGVTGWSAANWLKATGSYTDPTVESGPQAASEKLAVKLVTPNSGSYSYEDVLTVTWEQAGEVPKDSKACVLLRNQDSDKNFAFPGSGNCVDIAGAEPTRTLAAKLERTSGYDLVPGKYSVQVTLTGPSVGFKDGATLATDKSDRPITISEKAPRCTVETDKTSYSLGEDVTISWSSKNASSIKFVLPTDGKETLNFSSDKLTTSGSITLPASILGNVTITMKVVSSDGATADCKTSIAIESKTDVFKVTLNEAVIKDIPDTTQSEAAEMCRTTYNNYEDFNFKFGDVLKCYWGDSEPFLVQDEWKG